MSFVEDGIAARNLAIVADGPSPPAELAGDQSAPTVAEGRPVGRTGFATTALTILVADSPRDLTRSVIAARVDGRNPVDARDGSR